jgi:NAD(P)-dependent dehydrogenase (short-subunit alcohol dehydrogenase family)
MLAGRVALVTGASRGLGRAIAIHLADAGAAVAVAARTERASSEDLPGTIHETVAAIRAAGGQAAPFAVDLMEEEQVDRLVSDVQDHFGTIDLLVNNAALTVGGRPGQPAPGAAPAAGAVRTSQPPSITQVPAKAYRRHFAVNVLAPYRLMQLTLPAMTSLGRAHIINISSRAAFEPGPGPYRAPGRPALFAYGSTKAALHNLTQAVAAEGAPHGVAANVLIPSQPIATPGSTLLLRGQHVDQWGSAEDFARAAGILATVSADEVTGRVLWHANVLGGDLRGWAAGPMPVSRAADGS